MKKILVIHGPNLNLLGEREPGVYGTDTFESINNEIIEHAMKYEFHCDVYQSNHEGEIIDKLHLARKNYDGVILNAGAYTHYSYAIRDAIAAIKIPALDFIAVKYLLFTSSVITAQSAASVTREQSFSRSVIVCTAFIFPFVIQSVNSHVV